jgi:hypothetical protein
MLEKNKPDNYGFGSKLAISLMVIGALIGIRVAYASICNFRKNHAVA